MTFMFPDGRPLDDMEQQDVPRTIAEVFDRLAAMFENGGPTEAERDELAIEIRRAAALQRLWAQYGKWPKPTSVPDDKVFPRPTEGDASA